MRSASIAACLALFSATAIAQIPPASAESTGGGCAPFVLSPQLTSTPPVLGSTATLSVGAALPSTPGVVWISAGGPVLPPATVGICPVFLDLATALPLTSFVTDNAGQWSAAYPIPQVPALAGATFTLQAALFGNIPVPWPLPYVITNGLQLTLGL